MTIGTHADIRSYKKSCLKRGVKSKRFFLNKTLSYICKSTCSKNKWKTKGIFVNISCTALVITKVTCKVDDPPKIAGRYTESADYLDSLMNVYKISSSDLNNLNFIEYQAKKNKPIILSVGASR